MKKAAFPVLLSGKDHYIRACTNCCEQSTDHTIMSSSLLIAREVKYVGFRCTVNNGEPFLVKKKARIKDEVTVDDEACSSYSN